MITCDNPGLLMKITQPTCILHLHLTDIAIAVFMCQALFQAETEYESIS